MSGVCWFLAGIDGFHEFLPTAVVFGFNSYL